MEKIRILYIVSSLKRCGPNNQLFNIINNLDFDRFSIRVLTLSPECKDSFFDKFEAHNVVIDSLNSHRIFGKFSIKSALKRYILDFSPNVLHTQGYRPDTLVNSLSLAIPHVATIRNLPQEDYVMTYGKIVGTGMYKKHLRIMREIDCVIGVSDKVYANLVDNYQLNNVINIANGVDTDLYCPIHDLDEKEKIRVELSLPANQSLFISTGHLSYRKDPEFMILNFLDAQIANSILVLVGSGELHEKLVETYSKHSSIKFIGRSDRVSSYLKCADYYIACSKSEGLPNSVLEALACALPCLLSDIGPHKQILDSVDSCFGFEYKLDDSADFKTSLKQILSEDHDSMSLNARKVSIDVFSAKIMSQSYQKLYMGLKIQ